MFKNRGLRTISIYEQYAMITLGIVLMGAGFYYFLIPADLVAGGVSGFGLVLNRLFGWTISLTVFVLNMMFLALGFLLLGRKVFLRSIYGSLLFPFVLFLFETFSPLLDIENDFILGAVFGGGLLGLGFGYVLKYGGTSGGTDIPIKILHQKLKISISTGIYFIDGFIIFLGVIAFYDLHGITTGLYALITMFISGKVADMVVIGSDSKKAVQIITDNPNEIKQAVFASILRGITEVPIQGGFTNKKKTMLITVITKQEYYTLKNIVASIDPTAFLYVTPASEIHGEFEERDQHE
jgi:uncharacterized membrane-anchored protein YitT (DUF2179 family)